MMAKDKGKGETMNRNFSAVGFIASLIGVFLSANASFGQTVNSGSTGADGALTLTQPGVVEFNPRAFNPPLDLEGDNVFHFTTITVGSQTTVKLTAGYFSGPVYWLATGAVQIDGVVDLSGEDGHPITTNVDVRKPSKPGAGGYPGGIGGKQVTDAQPGGGPKGGLAAVSDGRLRGQGAGFNGNNFCVPLVGGSGGGGGAYNNTWNNPGYLFGSGGGAGGGAILIASSNSITLNGRIWANGGWTQYDHTGSALNHRGGGASGGSIRLVAPRFSGAGRLATGYGIGGSLGNYWGNWGRVRVETFLNQFTGIFYYERRSEHMPAGTVFLSSPSGLFIPTTPPPTIRVKSIAGLELPDTTKGAFEVPDVAVNSSVSVPVEIEAKNIPPGTQPLLSIFSEDGPDQNIQVPALAGTLPLSSAALTVLFPPGYSRGYVKATWSTVTP